MKLKSYIFLLGIVALAISVISACEPDYVPTTNPFNLPPSLEGNWNLKNTNGVDNGVNHNFPKNQIRWQFTPFNGNLKVVNNNIGGGVFDGPGSGDFSYELRTSDGEKYLFIQGLEYGQISALEDSTFVIDQRFTIDSNISPAYILSFER